MDLQQCRNGCGFTSAKAALGSDIEIFDKFFRRRNASHSALDAIGVVNQTKNKPRFCRH